MVNTGVENGLKVIEKNRENGFGFLGIIPKPDPQKPDKKTTEGKNPEPKKD